MTLTVPTTMPTFVAEWFWQLQASPLAGAVPDPAAAAVFSADMVEGFCAHGNPASKRLAALTHPVAELFRRAHAHGIRHFVLVQDAHDPQTPEFFAFPLHCVRAGGCDHPTPPAGAL